MEDKDKNKARFSFNAVDLPSYSPVTGTEKESSEGWYRWGSDNKYPYYLYDLYMNCSTLQSIINGSVDYTLGNGIVNNSGFFTGENQAGDTLEDIIAKIALDRWIFGGFAVQVIYNKKREVTETAHIDFRKLRTDKACKNIFYADFEKRSSDTVRYKFFNPDDLTINADGDIAYSQIYYYKGNKTRSIYPVPDYNAAIISAETQLEIQEFHYNTIKNNFLANTILSFYGDIPTDEKKIEMEEKINNKFSGAKNAARLMLVWADNKEYSIEINRLTSDDFDKKYETLAEATRQNLFISMSAQPQLFGMNVETGFSAIEYEDAFKLYEKTRIRPVQKEIVRVFDKITGMENSITFEPFKIDWGERV